MNNYKSNLHEIEIATQDLLIYSNSIRPTNKQLKWLAESRYRQELSNYKNNIEVALNHASTLIGYFDGYEARGAFQARTSKISAKYDNFKLLSILDFLNDVLIEIDDVVKMYSAKQELFLCSNGPTRPGVHRTTEISTQHLQSLKKMTCLVICKLTKNKEIQIKAKAYLNINHCTQ